MTAAAKVLGFEVHSWYIWKWKINNKVSIYLYQRVYVYIYTNLFLQNKPRSNTALVLKQQIY